MYTGKISASSLYHFAKSIDIVLSIIRTGFYPRTAREDMNFLVKKLDHAYIGTPMVCFTDIPLDHLEEHTKQYGEYGIGMNKEWGIRNGLNPILYVVDDSDLNKAILDLQGHIADKNIHDKKELKNVGKLYWRVAGYFKRYMESESIKPYYDEREWRYLVPFNEGEHIFRLIDDSLTNENIQRLNLEVQNKFPLKFTLEDIDNIIIPDGVDKNEIMYVIYNDTGFIEQDKSKIAYKIKTRNEVYENMQLR